MRSKSRVSNFPLLTAIAAVLFASPAHAHGQEVLTSIYAQLATVIVVVIVLFRVREIRRYWIMGLLGCITGMVLSWWVTADMPYRRNATLITAIAVASPILLTALAVFAAARWSSRRDRDAQLND